MRAAAVEGRERIGLGYQPPPFMSPVTLFLLSIAAIFLIGAVGEIIFQRTNIPDVIWLIFAGILLGPLSGLVDRAMLSAIAPYFAPLTLVVVLFQGGTTLKLADLSRAAPRSSLLALLTFIAALITMMIVSMIAAWVGLMPDGWSWTHGAMLGAILGGSSSIIIMPAMEQAKVEAKLANLVSLESALTDAFCVVTTVALIDVMLRGSTGASGPVMALAKSFGIGLVVGGVAGLVWLLLLRSLERSEHGYPITLSALLIVYVVIERLGGSAALGILTVAVILGNASSIAPKLGLIGAVQLDTSVRGFHRQMTFMIKSFFFVFIGAMLEGPWTLLLFGTFLGGLLFAARIPSTRLALVGSDLSSEEKNLVTVSMPRGMAAGVLATMPVTAGVVATEGLPVIVFACVLTSIVVFAAGFPVIKRGLRPAAAPAPPPEPRPMAGAPIIAASASAQPEVGQAPALDVPPTGAAEGADGPPAEPTRELFPVTDGSDEPEREP